MAVRSQLAALIALTALLAGCGSDDSGSPPPDTQATKATQAAASLSVERSVGQTLVGRYPGRIPTDAFVARIRRGELGGVILFADNVVNSVDVTRKVVDGLQKAAKAGGNPPLLIMTDQEGGLVKRLPGAPDRAARSMNSVAVARAQGAATGALLRKAGVNFDLAPVADVSKVRGSFLGTRTFGTDPVLVAQRACAFADGLAGARVASSLKHFPGLGRARGNTDDGRITIDAGAADIRGDLKPYDRCASKPLSTVMMSSATYPKLLGGDAPAVLSPVAYARELRRAGVSAGTPTISDDLDAGAIRGRDHPARRAVQAGLDLLLFASGPNTSAVAYSALVGDVKAGTIRAARVRDAAAAVMRLKSRLP